MSVVAFERLVRDELNKSVESVEIGILAGVDTFEEYRYLVGQRRGLIQALANLDDVAHTFDTQ